MVSRSKHFALTSIDLKAFCFTVGRPLPDTVIECEGLLARVLALVLALPSALVLLVLPQVLRVQTVSFAHAPQALVLAAFARPLGRPSFSPCFRSL